MRQALVHSHSLRGPIVRSRLYIRAPARSICQMANLGGLAAINIITKDYRGQATSNTFHVLKPSESSPPDLSELTALVGDIITWFQSSYLALIWGGGFFYSVSASQVQSTASPDPRIEYISVPNVAGTAGSAGSLVMPNEVCPVLSIHTSIASRRSRGHLFFPSTSKAGLSDNDTYTNTGTYWTAVQALAAKFAAGATTSPTWTGSTLSNFSLCVFSRTAEKASESDVFIASGAVVSTKVHFLRSRSRGTT
jgi:hypothetical protein